MKGDGAKFKSQDVLDRYAGSVTFFYVSSRFWFSDFSITGSLIKHISAWSN